MYIRLGRQCSGKAPININDASAYTRLYSVADGPSRLFYLIEYLSASLHVLMNSLSNGSALKAILLHNLNHIAIRILYKQDILKVSSQ